MEKYIDITCSVCNKIFSRKLRQYKHGLKKAVADGRDYHPLCSIECKKQFKKTRKKVSCQNCGKEVERNSRDLRKAKFAFCSRTCSATFHNNQRKLIQETKEVYCKRCNSIMVLNRTSVKKFCDLCLKIKDNISKNRDKISQCISCGEDVISGGGKKKYCVPCKKIFNQSHWSKIGKMSAATQVRRSKNEIYFAELCEKEFSKITTNDPIFVSKYGNWDADVIIHDHKIAVLWNGIWHYRQVRSKHSLSRVQARDKIKLDVIADNGFIPYTIKDMGKHNKSFVEEEFEKLKKFIIESE